MKKRCCSSRGPITGTIRAGCCPCPLMSAWPAHWSCCRSPACRCDLNPPPWIWRGHFPHPSQQTGFSELGFPERKPKPHTLPLGSPLSWLQRPFLPPTFGLPCSPLPHPLRPGRPSLSGSLLSLSLFLVSLSLGVLSLDEPLNPVHLQTQRPTPSSPLPTPPASVFAALLHL